MFKMADKLWHITSKKIDGSYNKGVVVGIEKLYNGIGYISEKQFLNDFEDWKYKLAYVDVCTKRATSEWIHYKELSKTKPE